MTSTHEPVKMEKAITAKQTDGGLSNEVAATPDLDKQRTGKTNTAETKTQPKTVTPPEGAGGNKPEDNSEKQVRFGDAAESTHRGRTTEETGAVLEFKTYRSPPRKRDEEVPSLCSTSSEQAPDSKGGSTNIPTKSISVDPSKDTTSPLASHEAEKNDKGAAGTEFEPKSPKPQAQSGSVYDNSLQSPGNYFLSSNPPTPPRGNPATEDSLEEKKIADKADCKPSPRTNRDHIVATPTNFALDYGKPHSETYDNSNVLAWLQSPTAHNLFSPGGLGSVTNTPAQAGAQTPRTPTVSTSFFFSDVASLPRNEQLSPKPTEEEKKSQKGGISNIICISPLASSKNRTAASASTTPMNFKDIFASPREKARGMPLLNDTPSKADRLKVSQRSASKDPSLDAVHLAERDLMEDEDLSVLLKLASNTPRPGERGAAPSVGPVFRSPNRRKTGEESDLPGLQIPMIGNANDKDTKTKLLQQKSSRSRDHGDADARLGLSQDGSKDDKPKDNLDNQMKPPSSGAPPVGLYGGIPPGYRADMPHYYPPMPAMPPGVPPGRTGSMRVAVGVPPPRDGKSGSPGRPGPHGPYPHEYPGMSFPHGPHPGMYPPYGPYGGMGRYPPYGHYPPPPPRHMMYGAQNPPGAAAGVLQDSKKGKAKPKGGPNKRPSPLLDSKSPGGNKKAKKSSPKKKNRSPQPESPGDRQRSAASIQAVNAASGGKNDKAAALAAAILRGVTMRPSGKWQAQLYFAGKSRYIGVFDSREKAALAYEIAREKLKAGPTEASLSAKSTENLVNAARKAAFEGVNERAPKT